MRCRAALACSFFALVPTSWSSIAIAESTIVDGQIYFADQTGQYEAYPWKVEDTPLGLISYINALDNTVIKSNTPNTSISDTGSLGKVVSYKQEIGNVTKLPIILNVTFNFGRFQGIASQKIDAYGVSFKIPLIVKEQFPSDESQKLYIQAIQDRIGSGSPAAEVLQTYETLSGFIASKPNLNAYLLLVQLVDNVVDIQNNSTAEVSIWPNALVADLSKLYLDDTFEQLTGSDQFRILSDLAITLGRSKNPEFGLNGNLKVSSLTEQLYGNAMNLAMDPDSGIASDKLATNLQSAYKYSCEQIGAESRSVCFSNIFDILSLPHGFNSKTTGVFLDDFAHYLDRYSEIPGLPSGSDEWVATITDRDDLVEAWLMFAGLESSENAKIQNLLTNRPGLIREMARAAKIKSVFEMKNS